MSLRIRASFGVACAAFLSAVATLVLGQPIHVYPAEGLADGITDQELKNIAQAAAFHKDWHWKSIGQKTNHLAKATKFEVLRGFQLEHDPVAPTGRQAFVRGIFRSDEDKPLNVAHQDVKDGKHGDLASHAHGVPLAPYQRLYKNGYRYERNAAPKRSDGPNFNPQQRTSVFVKPPLGLGPQDHKAEKLAWAAVQRWHHNLKHLNANDVHHYEMLHLLKPHPETGKAYTSVLAWDHRERLLSSQSKPGTYVHEVPLLLPSPEKDGAESVLGLHPSVAKKIASSKPLSADARPYIPVSQSRSSNPRGSTNVAAPTAPTS
ncbi:hypothetical protein CBOM_04550 [Ceraceosorus bombacis]|uniref:Uncharacterized protein n=1 Tax=Ceraceosorus bombacis TaxID=401625 RepID=A0A0P1BMV8_9BASI|nr:hypothetical protein CBOM_04550 [Ceraceosorus bombacis]